MEIIKPLVSINILSFNRKNELKNTLQKIYEQDYTNIEIIVVDNNSSDGSGDMVEEEFPKVKLIRLNENIGIAGWNEGFKIAKGEYVLVLDDDAYPDKQSIPVAVQEMQNNQKIGAIEFNIYNITPENALWRFPGGWLPEESIEKTKVNYFIGCAFIIKKNIYFHDLFPKKYFICFHEIPIARYLTTNNFYIFYDRRIKAYHINQERNKLNSNKEYYHYRNLLNFVLWNITFPFNFFYGFKIFLFFFFRSIRKGWFIKYLKALTFQIEPLHDYKLSKMNKNERRIFFQTEFIEYKLSKKVTKYFNY